MPLTFTLDSLEELPEIAGLVGPLRFPLKFEVRQVRAKDDVRFKLLNALVRDICRHKYGRMKISELEHEREIDRWKRTDVWPRYSDPEPNPQTGEVMYLPMSREHLEDDHIKGICNWMSEYMIQREIPSHKKIQGNWSIPEPQEMSA